MVKKIALLFIGIWLSITAAWATVPVTSMPLPANQAFAFTTSLNSARQLVAEWSIAPGYFLYRDSLHFATTPDSEIFLGKINLPTGRVRHDKIHGTYQIYTGPLKVIIPLLTTTDGKLKLVVNYQGCSAFGFCYAPTEKKITLSLKKGAVFMATNNVENTPQAQATQLLYSSNKFLIVLGFLGMGLLLAFTPCVLPMIPILSGIIVGQHQTLSARKAFLLSLNYVLGMALTYAIAGMLVALAGSHIQAAMQTPWVIAVFSGFFVLLAFSLFGFYHIQLPKHWRHHIMRLSHHQTGGTHLGVFVMGCLSSLVVSPCVSAPLVGVLAYIGQSGDVILGGTALLAMGFGIGIPLLLIGTSAGKFLPKAGSWMEVVQKICGVLLLGFAIWMLSRIIPVKVTLLLWATLGLGTALFMGIFAKSQTVAQKVSKGLGLLIGVYGGLLMTAVLLGNTQFLSLATPFVMQATQQKMFIPIKTLADLQQHLQAAKTAGKPVLVDFYADWCASCITFDKTVFANPDVQKALQNFVLLRADVTVNDQQDRLLQQQTQVVAPPSILFFDTAGQELTQARIVGEMEVKQFLDHLQQLDFKKEA